MTRFLLQILSALIFAVGFIPYISGIIRDRNKPDGITPMKVSWIIWWALDVVTLVSMYVKHEVTGGIITAVCGSSIVVVLALRYGRPGWNLLDMICLSGAIIGLILWKIFDDANIALALSLGIMILGSWPTFYSAWKDPSTENRLGWTAWWLGAIIGVLAIPSLAFAAIAQPVTFLFIESIMMMILYVRPRRK